MILLDCGNSRIKAHCWQDEALIASFASAYHARWSDALTRWFRRWPEARCFFTSVLDPERQAELDQCLAGQFDAAITRFVSEPESLGVVNAYPHPEKLGDDRWLSLLAAAELERGDCIVIDAGSALTVDLLRGDGTHLGGAILPGFDTSLAQFKRIFSYIDFSDPAIAANEAPGCSTEAAIQIDYAQNSIEVLPGLVRRWSKIFETTPSILLAGGDAERVRRALEPPGRIVPDLVFRGMRRLIRS